jgi:iron complex transport system substrate-binding protein
MRVVTLLPSATETVCALGVDPVGVTHECDYPPRVASLPTVVRSAVDAGGTSDEIDREVREAVAEGGVYDLDRERLRALDPDVVVTQGVCDVCAVDESVVRDAVDGVGLDAELVATHPHSLGDVLDDVERIGRALDRAEPAARLRAALEARVEAVRERVVDAGRPTATVLDWLDPVMVAGHWVPELVDLAGGEYRLGTVGERSGPVEWARLRAADPEVLVAAPCGFTLEQTAANLTDLTGREGWHDLRAARTRRAYALDGDAYVNRPGPRLVDTLEHLAAVLHPDRFETPPADAVRPVEGLAAAE